MTKSNQFPPDFIYHNTGLLHDQMFKQLDNQIVVFLTRNLRMKLNGILLRCENDIKESIEKA